MKRIEDINLNEYDVQVVSSMAQLDDFTKYLLNILNNRDIPEKNKAEVRKMYEQHITRLYACSTNTLILTPKKVNV